MAGIQKSVEIYDVAKGPFHADRNNRKGAANGDGAKWN